MKTDKKVISVFHDVRIDVFNIESLFQYDLNSTIIFKFGLKETGPVTEIRHVVEANVPNLRNHISALIDSFNKQQ